MLPSGNISAEIRLQRQYRIILVGHRKSDSPSRISLRSQTSRHSGKSLSFYRHRDFGQRVYRVYIYRQRLVRENNRPVEREAVGGYRRLGAEHELVFAQLVIVHNLHRHRQQPAVGIR